MKPFLVTMINVWVPSLCTYILPSPGYSTEFHANLPLMSSSLCYNALPLWCAVRFDALYCICVGKIRQIHVTCGVCLIKRGLKIYPYSRHCPSVKKAEKSQDGPLIIIYAFCCQWLQVDFIHRFQVEYI